MSGPMATWLHLSGIVSDLLAASDGAPVLAEGGGGMDTFIMIGMIFLIFWFLVIRPGSKERKTREAAIANLQKNDKVVTNAGIHGTVTALEDDAVMLRVDDKNNIRMKFNRAAIWQVLGADDQASTK